jgi:hypothetical protein
MTLRRDCQSALELLRAMESVVENEDFPQEVEALTAILLDLEQISATSRVVADALRTEASRRLSEAGTKSVAMFDGSTIRQRNQKKYSNIDREGLINYLRTLDPDLAETTSSSESVIKPDSFPDLLLRCFRQEPRWSQLASLGVSVSDYCNVETSLRIEVSPAEKS